VISAGSLAALQEFGYGPHLFDAIFGSSAGSINGAYFAASQAPYGTSIYFEDLTGPDFINLRRLVTKRPALDLGYLLGEVSVTSKPLDTKRVIAYQGLYTLATHAASGKKVVFGPAGDEETLRRHLRAGATVPVIAGRPFEVDGEGYVDAALAESVPWETPIERGFDFVLVLSTRPLHTAPHVSRLQRHATSLWLAHTSPELRTLVKTRTASGQARSLTLASHTENPTSGPYVYAICPSPSDIPVDQLERNHSALVAGARVGYRVVTEALARPHPSDFDTSGVFRGVF
jgi:predicted patatin/cPLA2 family phospholipase